MSGGARKQYETRRVLSHRNRVKADGSNVLEFETEWDDGSVSWLQNSNFNPGNQHLEEYIRSKFEVVPATPAPAAAPAETLAEWVKENVNKETVDAADLPGLLEKFKAAHAPAIVPATPVSPPFGQAETLEECLARLQPEKRSRNFAVYCAEEAEKGDSSTRVERFCRLLDLTKTEEEREDPYANQRNVQFLLAEQAAKEEAKKAGGAPETEEKRMMRLKTHLKVAAMEDKAKALPLAANVTIWTERWLRRTAKVVDPVLREACAEHHRIMAEIKASDGWLTALQYEAALPAILRDDGRLKFALVKHIALAEGKALLARAKRANKG